MFLRFHLIQRIREVVFLDLTVMEMMAIFSLTRLLEVELHFSYNNLFYKVLFSKMKSLIRSNSSEFQK